MATIANPSQTRDPRITALHFGAVASAIVSGAYALVELAVGTPFEFGVALAMCGAWWIAADYLGRMIGRARGARRGDAPSEPRRVCHVVFAGSSEHSSPSTPDGGVGLAA
ncbi:hypothetical protein A5707_11420 [Mycobacterium kyorinense]|uniref:Uncharacterized protein n=1 Tax=Mycobacterium kyorinense TaxID=487514 RepID=A0A1A2ZSB1_9MYCO|nr:hypothetical protein [Mycobacterium kyorinense]OBI53474.1 hypothetical protein A5707_11420 [Mycobacterium kyorinense]